MTQYLSIYKARAIIGMVLSFLKKLADKLMSTASNHKKKLIFIAILAVGYKIARRKLKTQNIISIVMFFMRIWAKVIDILPLPTDAAYRHIQPFSTIQQPDIPELASLIDIKQIIAKIKNKQPNALSELKLGVLSSVVLNIVLYKIPMIYDLVFRKYKSDFTDLGAIVEFEQSINFLKNQFIKNLSHFRAFVGNQTCYSAMKTQLSQMISFKRAKQIFQEIVDKLFAQSVDIGGKILSRSTYAEETKQYKTASNYFRTTKQLLPDKPKPILSTALKIVFSPVTLLYSGVHSLLKTPQQTLTMRRFQFNQYIYVLPLKKFKNNVSWPTLQSKYLFGMVIDEIVNFFYSINFNIVSQKRAQFNLTVFINRIRIYFLKRVQNSQKKFMELLPIFFKIIQQQMVDIKKRNEFYQRQLLSAFRDTKYKDAKDLQKSDIALRNCILHQIYLKNQLEHLQKDMQAKYYNERDGLIIEPAAKSSRIYQQKDDIEQLMNMYEKADEQKQSTAEQMQMMRELMR